LAAVAEKQNNLTSLQGESTYFLFKSHFAWSHQGGQFVGIEHKGAEVKGGGGHRPWGQGGVLAQGQVQGAAVTRGRLGRRHGQLPLLLRHRLYGVCFLLKHISNNLRRHVFYL
jgi:hypothetical protein